MEDEEEMEEEHSRRWLNHRGAVHISLSGDPRGNYLCRRALTLPLVANREGGAREQGGGHRGAAAAIERDRGEARARARGKAGVHTVNRSFSRNELEWNTAQPYDLLLTLCFMGFSKVTFAALTGI